MLKEYNIKPLNSLNDAQFLEAITIFVSSFKHLFTFAKKEEELIELFMSACDKDQCYAYIEKHKVLGFLGVGTNEKTALNFPADVCIRLFGKTKGNIISKQLQKACAKIVVQNSSDIYIDYLATDPNSRGLGIGTKMLEFVFLMPQYQNCYIEVLEKNYNAKRLYEKMGFAAYKKSFNLTIFLQGQGNPIKMKKAI